MATRKKKLGIFRRIPVPEDDFATDIRTAILIQSPKGGKYILWLVLLLFLALILWAYFSEVDQATRAGGRVIPSRQIQVVQNLEGGEMPLGESLKAFEEGMKLAGYCSNELEAAEKKVTLLIKESGGKYKEIPFRPDGDSDDESCGV